VNQPTRRMKAKDETDNREEGGRRYGVGMSPLYVHSVSSAAEPSIGGLLLPPNTSEGGRALSPVPNC
jgi:hypothetical protein